MSLEDNAKEVLLKNRRTTDGNQYTVPSPDTYPYQWFWDSCFHAIVLSHFEPDAAKVELRSLLTKQFSNGMIPHMIYWEPGEKHVYEWGVIGTSSLTQPPLLAYAAWEIYRRTNDMEFLQQIYPNTMAFYRYLIAERDPRGHNLISIINPDESGEDNSSRFDSVINAQIDISYDAHIDLRRKLYTANHAELHPDVSHRMKEVFWVKDVPFNAILIKNLRILAHIASTLKDDVGEHFATQHAGAIKAAMREKMFDKGVYWSTSGSDYQKLYVETWAHFAPLFADLYTHEEANALLQEHFHNDNTLRGEWGIRTVSRREQSYRPDGFWRGPVWMTPHWFIYKGLMSYGFAEEAREIRDSSRKLLEHSGFREYFNPETGEGYGAHDFTWGTLILDMVD
jgi:glycogen debranching enzyme